VICDHRQRCGETCPANPLRFREIGSTVVWSWETVETTHIVEANGKVGRAFSNTNVLDELKGWDSSNSTY